MRHRILALILAALAALAALGLVACGGDNPGTNENQNNNGGQPQCGDGIQQGAEECDNGTQNSDTQPDACRTDCTSARCGDGALDSGEGCDDGPQNSDVTPDV